MKGKLKCCDILKDDFIYYIIGDVIPNKIFIPVLAYI